MGCPVPHWGPVDSVAATACQIITSSGVGDTWLFTPEHARWLPQLSDHVLHVWRDSRGLCHSITHTAGYGSSHDSCHGNYKGTQPNSKTVYFSFIAGASSEQWERSVDSFLTLRLFHLLWTLVDRNTSWYKWWKKHLAVLDARAHTHTHTLLASLEFSYLFKTCSEFMFGKYFQNNGRDRGV